MDENLQAGEFIDPDHPAVRAFAERIADGASEPREVAGRLFRAVRDEWRYDPFTLPQDPAAYTAGAIAEGGPTFCVPKAILLAAAARSQGIPARLGFADVRNHLQSERLAEMMGTDLFVYHGYTALEIDGRWLKASPAFNAGMCERFGVPPLEFDGRTDALLHAYDGAGERYMKYVVDHGTFADFPFEHVMGVYRETYPQLAGYLDGGS